MTLIIVLTNETMQENIKLHAYGFFDNYVHVYLIKYFICTFKKNKIKLKCDILETSTRNTDQKSDTTRQCNFTGKYSLVITKKRMHKNISYYMLMNYFINMYI